MLREIRPAIVVLVALYAHYRVGLSAGDDRDCPRAFSLNRAQGSLIERDGKVVGSELIGQEFTSEKYFHSAGRRRRRRPILKIRRRQWPRPTTPQNSGGSNLGPSNKALIDRVQGDVEKLRKENPSAAVPADLVTTSASGLDPDISPGGCLLPGPACCQGAQLGGRSLASARQRSHRGAFPRSFGRAARECPAAQPRAGPVVRRIGQQTTKHRDHNQ